jgi:hypothetical protein
MSFQGITGDLFYDYQYKQGDKLDLSAGFEAIDPFRKSGTMSAWRSSSRSPDVVLTMSVIFTIEEANDNSDGW